MGKSDRDALALLSKPTIVSLKGEDQTKAVLVSAMLHGSEPCGLRAFLHEIQKQRKYPYNVYFFIGNVKAAQLQPLFSHRFIPGDVNYNRIWDRETKHPVAQEVCKFFDKIPLLAVLDIHSFTTKKNIPHCFITSDNNSVLQLATPLAPYVLISDVAQGTLIEHFGQSVPACTVECGTNNTAAADVYAIETLERFFKYMGLVAGTIDSVSRGIYHHEVNVKLKPETSVVWAMAQREGYNVTLRSDCEELNLTLVKSGTVIGWADSLDYFRVVRGKDEIAVTDIFRLDNGAILLARDCVPTLISTSEMIVKESGFYFFEKYVKS